MRTPPASRSGTLFFALLASTALCTGGPAFAQEQPGSGATADADANRSADSDPGAIIVTAQKREENLQDVPISIQALGTERLEEANVTSFNEYTKLLPSVSFQASQQGGNNVYIRGVASGGDGNHSGSLPSVGIYLDEQPVTTIGGNLDVHIYDIARIEVLRGPQGTLYGASSEAGTIRIITNKPDPKGGFYGQVDSELNTVRHGDMGGRIEGFVNVPIADSAALRVVGWYQHDGGYIDNVPGTRTFIPLESGEQISFDNADLVEKNINDIDTIGGRAALGIDLDDNWTATASVIGQKVHNHGALGYDPSVGDLKLQHFFEDFYKDKFVQAALTVEGKLGIFDITYAGAYLDRHISTSNDYTDYAEAYDSLYESAGGLAYYFAFNDDAGNLVNPSQHIIGRDHFTKMSHELRFATPAADRFRVVGGLFYQRQTHFIHQDYQVTGLASALSVNGFPGTLWLTQQDRIDKDYAAFGEASFDVTDAVTFTGGLRAYKYDNSLIGFFGFGRNPGNGYTDSPPNAAYSSRTGVIQCFTTTGQTLRDNLGGTLLPAEVDGSPCTNLGVYEDGKIKPKSTSGSGVTYRFNVDWKVTPDHLLYATVSKGFRPGGINRRTTIQPYDEDSLINYEIGFKTSWPGRLHVNGALYRQDWKKFQYSFLGVNSFTEIHNGPDARIKGAELDVSWTALQGLSLSSSAAYTDAKTRRALCAYDDPSFACTAPGPTGEVNYVSSPAGTRLPITPKLKLSATARYEWEMGSAKMHVHANLTHASSASTDLRDRVLNVALDETDPDVVADPASYFYTADSPARLKAYTMADFAFGGEWHNISAEVFIENAFDKRAVLSKFIECGSCFQRPYSIVYTPRTIGLRVGTKF